MGILELVIVALVVIWILGFFLHIGGSIIHLLLVLAVILIVARVLGLSI